MIRYHLSAFLIGAVLDVIIGDPHRIPHPVTLIGKWIHFLDVRFRGIAAGRKDREETETRLGALMAVLVLIVTAAVVSALLFLFYHLSPIAGVLLEAVMTCQIFAAKSLYVESRKVYEALRHGTLKEARHAVSMIVGRDTMVLDAAGVMRAAVETVAENTSDGVITPMLYTALGGPILGFLYKAVSTMDSMVGYRNDTYRHFGTAAARLDDAADFLPSRLAALILILAAFLDGKHYSGKNAYRIWKRDRRKHASPNSAQTESVMAGALGLRLAGPAVYFGKRVEKPYLGDALREIVPEDILLADRLMWTGAVLFFAVCVLVMAALV